MKRGIIFFCMLGLVLTCRLSATDIEEGKSNESQVLVTHNLQTSDKRYDLRAHPEPSAYVKATYGAILGFAMVCCAVSVGLH